MSYPRNKILKIDKKNEARTEKGLFMSCLDYIKKEENKFGIHKITYKITVWNDRQEKKFVEVYVKNDCAILCMLERKAYERKLKIKGILKEREENND